MDGLKYIDDGHIYVLDGERLPCVSDLCRFLSREIYRDTPVWQMEAAADRGTKVHAAAETLDRTGKAEIEEEYLPYLEAYAAFLREHDVSWDLIEHPDYHPIFRYAGTLDRYGVIDGSLTLLDTAVRVSTGKRCSSETITMKMAQDEGWLGKQGSKWRTMPQQMMMYRAAAFFARVFCPDILLGIPTYEEVQDVKGYDDGNGRTVVTLDGQKQG